MEKRISRAQAFTIQERSLGDAELMKIVKDACYGFVGPAPVLESALGALCFGRIVGWHGLRVIHTYQTLRRYEGILGIKFRDVLPARTVESSTLGGIRIADGLGKFWRVITAGLVPAREGCVFGRA
jgi:hypothetical protein